MSSMRRLITNSKHYQRFWRWTTQERPHWKSDFKEAAVAFVVFGITGSSSVAVIKPVVKTMTGLDGSLLHGPISYQVACVFLLSPLYGVALLFFGTVFGRHLFFAKSAIRIIGRFMPGSFSKRFLCTPAKLKQQNARHGV